MKKAQLITVILISLVFLSVPAVKSQCISDTNNIYTFTYNNAVYEIVKEKQIWINASACAVERGGKLAEINSQEEQDSVFFHVNNAGKLVKNESVTKTELDIDTSDLVKGIYMIVLKTSNYTSRPVKLLVK